MARRRGVMVEDRPMTSPSYPPREPRERLHLRRPAAEVRPRRRGRDRLRPQPHRGEAGAGGHRPRASPRPGTRSGWPTRWRSSASRPGSSTAPTSSRPTRAWSRRSRSPASTGPWDAIVAVGGGSSIDTAKAVNLMTTNPGELMDYINKPVGGGKAPVNPLLPLVAVPTTTGTGAESTTICVMDVLSLKVKTGISHARLRPMLAVVDPNADPHPAGRGHRRLRDGHPLPRAGELHRAPVHQLRPQAARGAGALLRLQPHRGPVRGEVALPARERVPAGGARRGRLRGAVDDGDGRHVRRHGLRQRRACTSRTPTPTRSPAG